MRPRWATLSEPDRAAFRATTAFLNGRLEERRTIDWALQLKSDNNVVRSALLDFIDSPEGQKINEPWLTAWRLIEESWENRLDGDRTSTETYLIRQRLKAGDRSGALIGEITKLVSPMTKVKPFSSWELQHRKLAKHPKSTEELFSTRLTSNEIVDPGELGLASIEDEPFLTALGNALDGSVVQGIDIARRIGWDGERGLWYLGQLNRVYYVPASERLSEEHEPDEFHRGMAPSVKLLCFVVSRLCQVAPNVAISFVSRWRFLPSPIHVRLWAALSRDRRITPANEVGSFLLSLDDRQFWNLHNYPEVAELRAVRFNEFETSDQAAIAARLRRCLPRSQWPKKADSDSVEHARIYWAVREFRRIEVAGATLPVTDQIWLHSRVGQFPDLLEMARIDEGFMGTPKARWVPPNPDDRYELLTGEGRLKALEAALSSPRAGWDNDPAGRASDWISQQGNPIKLLVDFESTPDAGAAFPKVWERFGWAHSLATEQKEGVPQRDLSAEAARVLLLLRKLPMKTAQQAIDGISNWLSAWEKLVVKLPTESSVWLKFWPIAVEATNARQPVEDEIDLNTIARPSDDSEPMDLDTLNTPAGKLVGVFLAMCPNVQASDRPFSVDGPLKTIRDTLITAAGRAGLIVKHRLIEGLPYFLRADPDWTKENLIAPLISENIEALALWRAIARRTQFADVLGIIGGPMAERATDKRLGRETRRSLVFSLVVECLHAFREKREPVVAYARIQQMLRSLDDEVRAHGAEAIQRFVRDASAKTLDPSAPSPEELFRSAAKPFLHEVWPQERSLSTPGVSRALADLPATARGAFAEAVDAIERFLVPFECWSMLDYGLYGEEENEAKLSMIDNPEKASAFLRLLDHTIGTAEASVIPYDLGDALDQVRKVSLTLVETPIFRRLATAARRT
jgi:hypothetical protein